MTIFQKIINDEIKSYKLFENDKFIVILDAFPKHLGHTMIIPKIQHDNILQENNTTISELFILAQRFSKILLEAFETKDIKWVVNTGSNAGQVVFHTHLHLIPFYDEDKPEIINKTNFDEIRKIILKQMN